MPTTPLEVLLADADEVGLHVTADMLTAEPGRGLTVTCCTTLREARTVLGSQPMDVVVTELNLPDAPGLEVISQLLVHFPRIPVIVLARGAPVATSLEAIRLGAQDCLVKGQANVDALVRTVRNATERARYREALRQSEERFHRLAQRIPDIIYRIQLRPEFRFEYVSPAVTAITGYTPDDHYAIPNLAQRLIHPEDQHLLATLVSGGPVPTEPIVFRWIHRDGHEVWTEHRMVPERDPAGNLTAIEGIARDVSNQHREEARLKLIEEQLLLSQKLEAVGRLAGGVAHDFNNLLTTVLGYCELGLERTDLPDPVRKSLEAIRKAGERATALTRQLLAFSRKQLLQPKLLDLNGVIREMDTMLQRLIGEDIEFSTRLAPDLAVVRADPGQIEQVIMNLAVNARDAMPDGGRLIIETSNALLSEAYAGQHPVVKPGPYVLLTVSDSGTGMSPEVQAQVFEPFFTTKEKGKGTGLGLATAYGIIKQSLGYIFVYSEPAQGAVFKIYLPQVVGATAPPPDPGSRATVVARTGGTETILLAEDETPLRELAKTILADAGYRVLTAGDGIVAEQLATQFAGPIHLLLTDVIMPRMNGRELTDRLAPQRPGMRVLYMSGYTAEMIGHRGVLDPGVAFMEKPFTPAVLLQRVRETLGPPAAPHG